MSQTATKAYNSTKTKIVNGLLEHTHDLTQSAVSLQSSTKSQEDIGVSENTTANHSAVSLFQSATVHSITHQSSIHPKADRLLIDVSDQLGPLNRDERRLAATFNYSRVMRYLALVDDVLRALDKLGRENNGVGSSGKRVTQERSH